MSERARLAKIRLCLRKRVWTVAEISLLIDSLRFSDRYLETFLLWSVSGGYFADVMLYGNEAEITLHRDCCEWRKWDAQGARFWRVGRWPGRAA